MPRKFRDLLSEAVFKTAPRSAFPQPNEVKYSSSIGFRYPIQRWILNPGDTIDVDLQQLTRFAPLAAPMMHHFTTEFIALDIPDRLALPYESGQGGYMDGGTEQFHNLFPSSGSDYVITQVLPQCTFEQYINWLSAKGINPIGTLLDFLGYPCFKDLYRLISSSNPDVSAPQVYTSAMKFSDMANTSSLSLTYQGVSFTVSVDNFACWIIKRAGKLAYFVDGYYREITGDSLSVGSRFDSSAFIDYFLNELGLTASEASKMWLDYVFSQSISAWFTDVISTGVANYQPMSLLPLYAYYVGIYDWFINTNISKPKSKVEWLSRKGLQFAPNSSYQWLPDSLTPQQCLDLITPEKALWDDDYFTSAFSTPAAGGSVSIAGLSTIQQFREASSVDRLRILLQYAGRRIKDQTLGLFGVKSSDARYDRCQVLGVARFNQQIEDVTQTSASDVNGVLGDFAGKSISVGSNNKFIHFTAEEHSTVMVFAVVKPVAVYDQVVPADILKVNPYDYLIPYLSNVGEQIVRKFEIYPNVNDSVDDGFGFQRRYAEYMWTPSRIMGDFGTSLDYWHDAREFDSSPTLNEQFVSVDIEQDNLDRIFSVPGDKENLRTFVYFDTVISRPLPKYIKYGF